MTSKVTKSDQEWRAQLDPLEYEVTRHASTERAFTGRYWDHHEHGIYTCVCCGTPLFESDAKFDSGCGWPSYFKPLNPENVRELVDRSHGMQRTEIICNPLSRRKMRGRGKSPRPVTSFLFLRCFPYGRAHGPTSRAGPDDHGGEQSCAEECPGNNRAVFHDRSLMQGRALRPPRSR